MVSIDRDRQSAPQLYHSYDPDDDDGLDDTALPLFETGDLGYLDDDGYHTLQVGRETSLIVVVSLSRRERSRTPSQYIRSCLQGMELLVFAAPHDELGEVVGIALSRVTRRRHFACAIGLQAVYQPRICP